MLFWWAPPRYLRWLFWLLLGFDRGPRPLKPSKPKRQPPVGAGWFVFPVPWYLRWIMLLSWRPFRRP